MTNQYHTFDSKLYVLPPLIKCVWKAFGFILVQLCLGYIIKTMALLIHSSNFKLQTSCRCGSEVRELNTGGGILQTTAMKEGRRQTK